MRLLVTFNEICLVVMTQLSESGDVSAKLDKRWDLGTKVLGGWNDVGQPPIDIYTWNLFIVNIRGNDQTIVWIRWNKHKHNNGEMNI